MTSQPDRSDPAGQPLHPTRRYSALIGVGGIGTGRFFLLDGNRTLGREESRGGHFLDRHDYCKLHIISHYVKAILGPDFQVLPLGKVGDDSDGRRVHAEMVQAGLDVRWVELAPGGQTMFSLCLIYPDGSGGNLTTDDSVCNDVAPACVSRAEGDIARFANRGMVLAAPEVPLASRARLLELGTRHGAFRAASFTSQEIRQAAEGGLMDHVDLVAINRDEACALADLATEGTPAELIVSSAIRRVRQIGSGTAVSITAGKDGSWTWDGATLRHVPACRVCAAGTAGAGDAHFAGILSGLAGGLTLHEAHQVGVLAAAKSVTSPHTIDKGLNRETLRLFAGDAGFPCDKGVERFLMNTGG